MSFKALDPADFVVSSDSVTAPAWSSNTPTLSTFYTGSTCFNTSSFYVDVYNAPCSSTNAAVQFSIAYGHYAGSGSAPLNSAVVGLSPTRITYGQYRNLVYGDAETMFNFGGTNTQAEDIIAIPIDRNRYKESLMPGTFNLYLTSGSGLSAYTLNLTDNSNDTSVVTYLDCGRVFDIVRGANGMATIANAGASKIGYTTAGSYGLFLPDIGLIILNPAALSLDNTYGGFGHTFYSGTDYLESTTNNTAVYNFIKNGYYFQLQSQETISSNYVFVRVRNSEFNYTSNPSFITGSGNLIYDDFIYSPQTYITTVGLYNTNNDLLAVAKLSKPLVKDFTKEALIRTKLDW